MRIDRIRTILEGQLREEVARIRTERGIPDRVEYSPGVLDRAIQAIDAMQSSAESFEGALRDFIEKMLGLLAEYAAYAWVEYCVENTCEGGEGGYVVDILEAIHDLYRAFERLDGLLFEERNSAEAKKEALEDLLKERGESK